jgi:hypothetical protein
VKRDPHEQHPSLPTINKTMKLKSFAPIVLLGLSLSMYSSMLVTHTPIAQAQVDESRKTNWGNLKKLYPLMVDAVTNQKRDEATKLIDEMKANLGYVDEKLYVVGQRLHEKDRNWPWAAKKATMSEKLNQLQTSLGTLKSRVQTVGTSTDSSLSDVKSYWQALSTASDDLMATYVSHGQELDAILKAFNAECPGCR